MHPASKVRRLKHRFTNGSNFISCLEGDIAKDLGVAHLNEFLTDEAAHNLLVFADSESRRHVRKVANNLGVDIEPYGYQLMDHSKVEPKKVTSKNIF